MSCRTLSWRQQDCGGDEQLTSEYDACLQAARRGFRDEIAVTSASGPNDYPESDPWRYCFGHIGELHQEIIA
jgi:hypothetical protein